MLSDILKRSFSANEQMPPLNFHITEHIVSLEDGRACFIIRLRGLPFETQSNNRLEDNYDSLNRLALSIARRTSQRLAVWCWHDHYQTKFTTDYRFQFEWLRKFSDQYMEKFSKTDIFENDFYWAFVLKPGANDAQEDLIRELEEIKLSVCQTLAPYEVEVLGTYYDQNEHLYSTFYEFIAYLYNGFWEPVPVTSLPLSQIVATSTLHHGYSLIERRFPHGGNQYMAFDDLKDFPSPVKRGMLSATLEVRFPFILCFSLTVLSSSQSIHLIGQTLNKMSSAGDEAVQQHEELEEGKAAVQAGEVYFGEFHGAMVVFGRTERECEDRAGSLRSLMNSRCMTGFVPATISSPETFFSLFPGNIKHRPRPMPKTTRNLFALFSLYTYSSGKQYGNPIGDGSAVIPLQTLANGVYHFNFHYSMDGVDSQGEKRAGHTLILGATGAGKTTLQTTLISHLDRFNTRIFGVDKDGSMRGAIEALGGTYFAIKSGEPTGLAPFQLPDTPFNRAFLYDLVEACGRRGDRLLSAEDSKDIKIAVDTIFELPFEHRRFGALLQTIPDRGEDCLARRLADWCYTEEQEGRYAYALDNPRNLFDWENFHRIGFDVSDFLVEGHPATEPILAYLFHLKELMTRSGGGLLATVIEEYWLPLKFKTTREQILDILKTGRRRDEFGVLVTQSPEDAIKDDLFPTILQQTPTKIYLPNPDAYFESKPNAGDGYSRFLTQKEFQKLKELGLQSRCMLIKQGSQAAIAKLDLNGMGDDIAVLAMAADDFPILERVQAEVGKDPDQWVPKFKEVRSAMRKAQKQAQEQAKVQS